MIGKSVFTTYLRLAASLIDDVYDVDFRAVTDGRALLPDVLILDVTRPELYFYSLDLNSGTLLLTFSEAVSSHFPKMYL